MPEATATTDMTATAQAAMPADTATTDLTSQAAMPADTATADLTSQAAMPATTGTVLMPATTGTATPEAVINVTTDPALGQILVGNNGMTLYIFTKDGPNVSNCTGTCATIWSPLLTQGSPTLGAGVDKTLVGTATLSNGSMVVTYNKMPLYTYSKDAKAGDVMGQKVGGFWFVVSPAGKPVGM